MSDAHQRLKNHIRDRQFQASQDGYRKVKQMRAATEPKRLLTYSELVDLAIAHGAKLEKMPPAPYQEGLEKQTPAPAPNLFVTVPQPPPAPVKRIKRVFNPTPAPRKSDLESRQFIATDQLNANQWHAILTGMFTD